MKTKPIRYILILSFLFYSIPCLICLHPESPDEVDYKYTSTLLSQTGRIWFESKGDVIFGEEGFIPRHFSYNLNGKVIAHGSSGFIIFLALLKLLLPDSIEILVNPLLAVACIYLIYRISKIIFDDEKKSLYTSILFASMPLTLRSAYSIIADLLNLTIFLIILLVILMILQNGNKKNYILLGIFLGLLPWARLSSVILFIPLTVFILLFKKKLINRNLILTLIITTLLIIGLLVFNLKVFGFMFTIGQAVTQVTELVTEKVTGDIQLPILVREKVALTKMLSFFHIHPRIIINNIRFAPATFLLAFPPIIFSISGLYYARSKEISKKFLIFFILLSIVFILFFLNQRVYGYSERHLSFHSSLLRYLLPFFTLLPIFTVIGVSKSGDEIKIVFYTLIILNLVITVFGPHGLAEDIGARLYYREASYFLLENTNEKSVVFSWYWDKSVFPDRIVFTKKDLTNEELTKLINKITDYNYNIYYIHHKNSIDKERFLIDNYDLEIIKGPILKNPILRFLKPPQDIYPIKIYKIYGSKSEI